MSRRRKHISKSNLPAVPASLEQVDLQLQELMIQKGVMWERLMQSDDPKDIMKALQYQQGTAKTNALFDNQKAFVFAPDNEFYNGLGFKTPVKAAPFEFLRNMAATPMIFSVISTRINQILEFSNFTTEPDRVGWTIRKKLSRFDTDYKNSDKDKRRIEEIVDFLENGGKGSKFTLHDDFHDFMKIFPKDLLELDQGCFELERTRGGDLISYNTVDSATIRLMETIDPNFRDADKYQVVNYQGASYYPAYCQVWRERVIQNPKTKQDVIWYPWEMCFAIRNKQSSLYANGYGQSELEVLMRIVTWLLESMEYNGRFFTNGSSPRGFFTMQGGVDQKVLNDFRMAWRSMVTGWQNAHKIPMFEAEKIQWVNMQNTNREMEYSKWMEFLTLITCSVYKIDPTEMGFRFSQQNTLFGQSGQKERLEHSKDKGLKPILKVIQKNIDKFIVSEIDSNYEFVFTGVDVEDEMQKLDMDVKKLQNGMAAMQDKFKEYSGREFDPEKDIILNSVYTQQKMQQAYGGQGMNQMVDDEMGGADVGVQNPFDAFSEESMKGLNSNPIMLETMRYIEQELTKK